MANYLMLDKNDITNVCGVISAKEIKKELNANDTQFRNFISMGRLFRNKYVLVEEEFKRKEKNCYPDMLVNISDKGRLYYATADGRFYVVYLNGKTKELKGFVKKRKNGKVLNIRIGKGTYQAKNLIASLYIKAYKQGDIVTLKNNDVYDVSVENLIVIDRAKYGRETGPLANSKKVGLFVNNKLINEYRSARQAGLKNYCSYQMVIDACNNKYKTKELDFRWL